MPGTTSNSGLAEPARTGFAPAAAYDAHRPTYPTEAVETLLARLGVTGIQHAKIADLAAGTGKLTELLAARPENYDIIAVEPHDGMREQLRQKNLGGVKVIKGTAESMPEVADGSLAAVVVAQVMKCGNRDACIV